MQQTILVFRASVSKENRISILEVDPRAESSPNGTRHGRTTGRQPDFVVPEGTFGTEWTRRSDSQERQGPA